MKIIFKKKLYELGKPQKKLFFWLCVYLHLDNGVILANICKFGEKEGFFQIQLPLLFLYYLDISGCVVVVHGANHPGGGEGMLSWGPTILGSNQAKHSLLWSVLKVYCPTDVFARESVCSILIQLKLLKF